jgi:zinc/manganese transport system substrate-binding protein
MIRRFFISIFALLVLFLGLPLEAAGPLKIVTSTEDLAALAREVGGDRIRVESLSRGYQDPHFVEAKPSFILKLHEADLLILVGRELEIGWLPPLIDQSRNARILRGAGGYLDASLTARILEIPQGQQVTRAMGDVHPLGNPHYWLDPGNGRSIARAIADRLALLDPKNAAYFAERYTDFDRRLAEAEKRWETAMAPYRETKIVTYHRSWPNFCEYFGLVTIGEVEPKPGIPPTPGHTLELINLMKREGAKLLFVEPYFDKKTPNSIAQKTGARVLEILPSVGGEKEVTDYFKLFDWDINLIVQGLKSDAGK